MKNNVTIKDIANELGLSATAVSRALRNMPDISEETRERVKAQAEKMHYNKNYLASTLRTQSSHTIGFIMDIVNPVYIDMYRGVQDVCKEHGYTILFSTSNEIYADEAQAIDQMQSHRVDGIILCPTPGKTDNVRKLKKLGIPFVLIGRTFEEEAELPSVVADDCKGGYAVCQHLLEQGHRSFLYLTAPLFIVPAKHRFEGFLRCLTDHGLDASAVTVEECVPSRADAYRAIAKRLENGISQTAIVGFNDYIAIGALKCLIEQGISVPEQIAVAGYDNIAEGEFACPSLSSADILAYRQGREGMSLLLALMGGTPLAPEQKQISLDPLLVVRRSTGGADRLE